MAPRSLSDLLQDILDNLQDLVRSEARLAKAELRDELGRAKEALWWNAVAAMTAFLAFAYLLMCGFFALRYAMPAWMAAAIISVSLGAVCGLSLFGARKHRSSRALSSPASTMQ
jgi:hypothetical protein